MNSRRGALLVALSLLAAPLAAPAQTPAQFHRIGYLWPGDRPSSAPLTEAFLQALRGHGYEEGRNILIDWQFADGKADRLPRLASELVRRKVDVIVAVSPEPVRAAREATAKIPIIMVAVADPVTYGFVASLARPGGNVTGMAFILPEIAAKRLELLKATVPRLSRVAVLWNAGNPALDLKALQTGARASGVTLQSLEVRSPDDFEHAFKAAVHEGASGLLTLEDPFTLANRARIVELALAHKLPAIYAEKIFVDAGGLMSYGPILVDNFRRGAAIVDRVLKGARPADLPVEQPTKFEFVVNLKAAKALGLTISPSLLLRADRVIE